LPAGAGLRDLGPALVPLAFLVQPGIENPALFRMQRHWRQCTDVAKSETANAKVGWVTYAGWKTIPVICLHKKYSQGAGSVFTGPECGYESVKRVNGVKLFSHRGQERRQPD